MRVCLHAGWVVAVLVVAGCAGDDGDGGGSGGPTDPSVQDDGSQVSEPSDDASVPASGATDAGGDGDGDSAFDAGAPPAGDGTVGSLGWTNHVPGTRLRARTIVSDGGERAWIGWQDSARGERCDFRLASDGTTRCLPYLFGPSEVRYLDDACTDPVYSAIDRARCEPGDYIVLPGDSGCGATIGDRYHTLGPLVTLPETLYAMSGDNCIESTHPGKPLHRLGPELEPAQFVEATYGRLTTGERIEAQGEAATDGTRGVRGWVDTELDGQACRMNWADDGMRRCMPLTGRFDVDASSTRFADATCSEPLYGFGAATSCSGEVPSYVTRFPERDCPAMPYGAYRVDARFDGQAYSGEACDPTDPIDGFELYRVSVAPPTDFAAFEQRASPGDDARLERLHDVSPGGTRYFAGHHDTQTGVACNFAPVGDGDEYRCLPERGHTIWRTFSDDACSVPRALLPLYACTALPLPRYITGSSGPLCEVRFDAWETGATVTAASLPPLWEQQGADCVMATPEADSYVEVTAVDVSLFARGELRVD